MNFEFVKLLNSEARTKLTAQHVQYAHLSYIIYLKLGINLKNQAPRPTIIPARTPLKF